MTALYSSSSTAHDSGNIYTTVMATLKQPHAVVFKNSGKEFAYNDDTAVVAVTATLQIPATALAHNGNIFTYSSSNVYTQ